MPAPNEETTMFAIYMTFLGVVTMALIGSLIAYAASRLEEDRD